MNRRGFLSLFAGAAAAEVARKAYFFAPIGGWKSDVIVNPSDWLSIRMVKDYGIADAAGPRTSLDKLYEFVAKHPRWPLPVAQ